MQQVLDVVEQHLCVEGDASLLEMDSVSDWTESKRVGSHEECSRIPMKHEPTVDSQRSSHHSRYLVRCTQASDGIPLWSLTVPYELLRDMPDVERQESVLARPEVFPLVVKYLPHDLVELDDLDSRHGYPLDFGEVVGQTAHEPTFGNGHMMRHQETRSARPLDIMSE